MKPYKIPTRSFLNSLFCCLFLMDGLVSNEWGRFLFFDDTIAAAAATPTGPINLNSLVGLIFIK